MLVLVTFGLFLAYTFGLPGPAPEPSAGTDATLTVFTDLPTPPDAPAMGLGGITGGLSILILCGLITFVLAAAGSFAVKRCRSAADLPALLN